MKIKRKNPKITYLLVQQASTILPGDDNTRLSNTYIHKEELGDKYKVVFSQFVSDSSLLYSQNDFALSPVPPCWYIYFGL